MNYFSFKYSLGQLKFKLISKNNVAYPVLLQEAMAKFSLAINFVMSTIRETILQETKSESNKLIIHILESSRKGATILYPTLNRNLPNSFEISVNRVFQKSLPLTLELFHRFIPNLEKLRKLLRKCWRPRSQNHSVGLSKIVKLRFLLPQKQQNLNDEEFAKSSFYFKNLLKKKDDCR